MNSLKNTLRIVIITIFILLIATLSSEASTGIVSTETLKMRKEASTDSDIVTLLSEGFEMEIIEKQDNWYKVKYKEYTGYVHGDYIKIKEKDEEEQPQQQPSTQTNTTPVENKPVESNNTQLQANMYAKVNSKQSIFIVPLINSSIIETVEKDTKVYIIQVINGWCYVSSSSVNGWIRIDKLNDITTTKQDEENNTPKETNEDKKEEDTNTNNTVADKKIGYINSESVNFRKKADKTSEVIDVLTINTQVNILSEETGWYKIEVNGVQGYVAQTLISNEKVAVTSSRSIEESRQMQENPKNEETTSNENVQTETNTTATAKTSKQEEIVAYAKTFLGCKYVYGGTTPNGFDCSGFVQYVYKHFGYSVSRSSGAQAKDGVAIDKSNLQPGDILIFKAYNDYSRIGHVGIYIGNNSFIHANDESTGVIITSLSKGKYPERFVTGRRII